MVFTWNPLLGGFPTWHGSIELLQLDLEQSASLA
jgi:hypothetical protein